MKKATFAGGCFWCIEPPFHRLEGVIDVYAGYTGGKTVNPTYDEVTSGRTGHLEAAQVIYDPAIVSYETLLETFWHNIDPTDDGGQFADRGSSYKTAIFYHDEEQRLLAEKSKKALAESGMLKKPIVTDIREAGEFYRAEEYHQDYYKKNPLHYNAYKKGSGRADYLERMWGQK
ncbi:peptide-methionine (S)-S-oxide reductase MsrA [bacterium]|nr:peptide-methionine (S)-S-oxide reductase MsrA [bacterium]